MHNVTRYFKEGCICFFTHVTYLRRHILVDNVDLIWKSIESLRTKHEFDLIAWVVIPDHLHLIIDHKDSDPSLVIKNFKLSFAAHLRKRLGLIEGRTWHNRYWDHIIRDQEDMNRHIDYIHYNPVKHGLVTRPRDYPHSSFNDFLSRGEYDAEWGCHSEPEFDGKFGE